MRKGAGFAHRDESIGPGDLAVRCPACPQPDVNLPEDWKQDTAQYVFDDRLRYIRVFLTAARRWKYTRSVVMDGNFSAQHRKMRNPSDDVPLADGHAFMVKDAPYKDHLQTAKEYNEVNSSKNPRASVQYLTHGDMQKSTCNDHRAVFSATVERAKLEATGIGAAACSRHGFFAPHACVDFQQGERCMVST